MLKVATWNTEWAPPGSKRGAILRERLAAFEPDLVCLTECHTEFLDSWDGHSITSGPDWGYGREEQWREVLLWSRRSWRNLTIADQSDLPPGRFVCAQTSSELGEITVCGMVVPYHFAHVRDGRRDRRLWEEHCLFLDALPSVLSGLSRPVVALGDFNQRIPSNWVKSSAREKLNAAFSDLIIASADHVEFGGRRTIDHIAHDRQFAASKVGTLSNISDAGRPISDHFGVTATLG